MTESDELSRSRHSQRYPLGEGNRSDGDVDGARADPVWFDGHLLDERTAIAAGQSADEIASDSLT
ncbi:hypothetical protein ACNS7O_15120 (plasmid) [Haloferacaceae archaeon DSL9]